MLPSYLRIRAVIRLGPSLALLSCATFAEQSARRSFGASERPAPTVPERAQSRASNFDGTLSSYVAYAAKNSPELRASFERWRAAVLTISKARRLPEPTIGYGAFLRNVETRVGPQRHRFSLAQSFPWPTKLSAAADSVASMARSKERQFDAQLLAVKRKVAEVYFRLWEVGEAHRLMTEHDQVLQALLSTATARMETGSASLADVSQISLGINRHYDHHGQHAEMVGVLSQRLASAMGAPPRKEAFEAKEAPQVGLPQTGEQLLLEQALQHPRIESSEFMAQAALARERKEAADQLPSFRLGLDYIETGRSEMDVPDNGKDPIIVSIGLSLPIWVGSYNDAMEAARAEGAAYQAERDAGVQRARSELEAALSQVRDARRRYLLHRDTLIPQAQTTLDSVLGGYQVDRSSVASLLMAQQDLLALQLGLARAQADHAIAWAALEEIVGKPLELDADLAERATRNER